jgi:hypothetical protein
MTTDGSRPARARDARAPAQPPRGQAGGGLLRGGRGAAAPQRTVFALLVLEAALLLVEVTLMRGPGASACLGRPAKATSAS